MDEEKRVFFAENFRLRPRFCRREKVVGTTAFLEGKMILTAARRCGRVNLENGIKSVALVAGGQRPFMPDFQVARG